MENESWILVVDDDKHNREMVGEALQRAGFSVAVVGGVMEAMDAAGERDFDAIMSDIKMSPLSGMDLLQKIRDSSPETPVVLLTAFGSLETAIQAMKQGAFDYITKPVNLDELALVMNRAVQHHRLVRDHRHLSRAFDERVRAASFLCPEVRSDRRFGGVAGGVLEAQHRHRSRQGGPGGGVRRVP